MRLSRGLMLIYVTGFLRSLGVGMLGVVLALYLSRVGVSATSIGLVIGVGLLGACAATVTVTWAGTRIGYRASLVALSLLAAAGDLGLVVLPAYRPRPRSPRLPSRSLSTNTNSDLLSRFRLTQFMCRLVG